MQTAAYVGLKVRGILGAFVTYVSFGLPAVLLILILRDPEEAPWRRHIYLLSISPQCEEVAE
jgi:hypothetical protein